MTQPLAILIRKQISAGSPLLRWISLLLALGCLSSPVLAQSGRKIALLIGIGGYPAESGWQRINAPNDLTVMQAALQKRGFPADSILVLKDGQATRQGILDAWKKELFPRVRPADVVYVQFSGHGQQVADDNGDELDGYDEAIVPYDSPMRYKAGVYQGENLIRDDELNRLLTDLRRRLGPKGNLMFVVDACHSGTSTRGMGPARGTIIQMASPEYNAAAAKRPGEGMAAAQLDSSAGDPGRLAPMVAFFGSAHNQLNFETQDEQGQYLGPLTCALSRKLCRADSAVTYRGLFDQVRLEMSAIAPRQQPQAEGDLDQELLGGRLLDPPACYRVLRWNDPGSVVVDAGWVQGLNPGAVLGLYPPETRRPVDAAPLARGAVARVSPFEATLTLDVDVQQPEARQAWVYVLEENLGDLHLGLSLQLPDNHPLRPALLEKITKYPVIRLDETPELYITQTPAGAVQLLAQGDLLLDSMPASAPPASATDALVGRMMNYAQAKYLRRMDVQSPALQVTFELVPVRFNPQSRGLIDTLPVAAKTDATGRLHFQERDSFKIRVTNQGEKAAYFTLIDIQPDNVINVVAPSDKETPAELRVGPGQTVELRNFFQVGPPAGVEMFKLIATEKPVDLRPLVQTKGRATKANTQPDPLEKLFGQTYFNDDCLRRRGQTTNLGAGTIHVHSFTFTID